MNLVSSFLYTFVMQVLSSINEDTRFSKYIHNNVKRVLTSCSDAGIIDR